MKIRIGLSVLSVLILSACSTNEPQELQNENYQSPDQNTDTCLVGWFPAVTPKSGVLTFDISDGATDVMLTHELGGNVMHQLCRLVVSVIATSPETVARWGTVTSVLVKDLPTTYIVTLPGGTQAIGSADLLLNERGGATKMLPVALSSTRFEECGYLLTAPLSDKLTLLLTGGNGEQRIIEAPLPAGEGFNSGYIYHLKLNLDGWGKVEFQMGTPEQWEEDIHLDVVF